MLRSKLVVLVVCLLASFACQAPFPPVNPASRSFNVQAVSINKTLLAPQLFIRETGKPVTETRTFTVSAQDLAGTYKLAITNGPSPHDRISSATIKLNGQVVAGPDAFNQQVASLDLPLTALQAGSNILEVTIASKPNSALRIGIAGTVPGPDPQPSGSVGTGVPAGLVAWWSGDGHPFDLVGEHHGTLLNGATFAAGKADQALKLDGVDDYVNVASTFNFPSYSSPFTLDAWINTTSTAYSFILAYGSNTVPNSMVSLGIAEGGALKSTTGTDTVTGGNVADGNWHHVAVSFDGRNFTLYLDGQVVRSKALAAQGALIDYAYIGRGYENQYFKGLIDEVELYDRALSQAEIQTLFEASGNRIKPPTPSPLPIPTVFPSATPLPTSSPSASPSGCHPQRDMVAWWPLDEGSGTVAEDIARNNDGNLFGPLWTDGIIGNALDFDGANDYVEVPHSEDLRIPNNSPFSLEAWINPGVISGYQQIVDKGNPYSGPGYSFGLEGDHIIFQYGRSGYHASSHEVPQGGILKNLQWHHVVATFDGVMARIYINGQLTVSKNIAAIGGTWTDSLPKTYPFNVDPLDIGRRQSPLGDGPYYYHRKIDDISIYRRALSSAEIKAIYETQGQSKRMEPDPCPSADPTPEPTPTPTPMVCAEVPGAAAWWSFDEGAGNTVSDFMSGPSGQAYQTQWQPGVVGKALSFNGVNSYVEIPHSEALKIPNNSPFTFDAWMMPRYANYHILLDKGLPYFGPGFSLALIGTTFLFQYGQSGIATQLPSFSPYNLSQGRWYHVAATYDGQKARLYVDGEMKNVLETGTRTDTREDLVNTDALDLGRRNSPFSSDGGYYYAGLMDEVTIYKRALSDGEISAINDAMWLGKCRNNLPPPPSGTPFPQPTGTPSATPTGQPIPIPTATPVPTSTPTPHPPSIHFMNANPNPIACAGCDAALAVSASDLDTSLSSLTFSWKVIDPATGQEAGQLYNTHFRGTTYFTFWTSPIATQTKTYQATVTISDGFHTKTSSAMNITVKGGDGLVDVQGGYLVP